jgi:hypothetical protein
MFDCEHIYLLLFFNSITEQDVLKKSISLYHYSHLNPSPAFVPDTEIRILQTECKYNVLYSGDHACQHNSNK